MVDGKVIVGWRTTKDEVYQDSASKKWIENQLVELLFEDDTVKEMHQTDFNRVYESVTCKKMGEITDNHGNLALKLVRLDNNKEYTVGVQFVN